MKHRNLFLTLLLSSLILLTAMNARTTARRKSRDISDQQRIRAANKDKVEFDLRYDFSMQAIPSKMNFVTLIPRTIAHRQEILDIKYSTRPRRIFTKNANTYAEFAFSRPRTQFTLRINVKAELYRYDLFTAKKQYKEQPPPKDPNLSNFIQHEHCIQKNHASIHEIAETIRGQTEIDIVKNIYDFVTDRLRYVPRTDELGAVKALAAKQGDCVEYADLFVAICRAKNIPARVIKGYVTKFDDSPEHAWAEVYLTELGWVPFDLTYGDVKQKSTKNKRFQKLKPIYIYLTSTRNDPILDEAVVVQGLWVGEVKLRDSIVFK
ncbi:MAG: transglutaminase domain-containing protein [Planctomycetota bacterium]|nr:MAG: transglutaminase domain-containing protein [Planctomycetota bacterium]